MRLRLSMRLTPTMRRSGPRRQRAFRRRTCRLVCDNSSKGLPRLSRRCSQQNWTDVGTADATNGRQPRNRRATESEQYSFVQQLERRQFIQSTRACFARQRLEQRFRYWRDTVHTLQTCCRSR